MSFADSKPFEIKVSIDRNWLDCRNFTTNEEAAGYLAAMIDGEGTVTDINTKGFNDSRRVSIVNTEYEIIIAIREALQMLEIEYSVTNQKLPSGKTIYRVAIYKRKNFRKVLRVVPIRSVLKYKKLINMILAYREDIPTREVLYNMYINDNLSAARIAKRLGYSEAGVLDWLHKYKIPVRSMRKKDK